MQPFAGYPARGTARAWLDAGGVPRTPGRVIQECGVGLVPVRIADDALAFAAPPLIHTGPVVDADLAVALSVIGVTPADVVAAQWLTVSGRVKPPFAVGQGARAVRDGRFMSRGQRAESGSVAEQS